MSKWTDFTIIMHLIIGVQMYININTRESVQYQRYWYTVHSLGLAASAKHLCTNNADIGHFLVC